MASNPARDSQGGPSAAPGSFPFSFEESSQDILASSDVAATRDEAANTRQVTFQPQFGHDAPTSRRTRSSNTKGIEEETTRAAGSHTDPKGKEPAKDVQEQTEMPARPAANLGNNKATYVYVDQAIDYLRYENLVTKLSFEKLERA